MNEKLEALNRKLKGLPDPHVAPDRPIECCRAVALLARFVTIAAPGTSTSAWPPKRTHPRHATELGR